MASFSERMKKLRKKQSITLEQLANEIDVTKSTLSRYENNQREPKMYIVKKLASYFTVSVDYLLGNSDEPRPADKVKEALSDDPELQDFWDELSKREDLQLMLKQTKDLPPKTVRQIIRIIQAIEQEEEEQ